MPSGRACRDGHLATDESVSITRCNQGSAWGSDIHRSPRSEEKIASTIFGKLKPYVP